MSRNTILFLILGLLLIAVLIWWRMGFSLEIFRFFAAEPAATPIQGDLPEPPAGAVSCAPATQSVTPGTGARLTASGGSAGWQWFAPEGTLALPDSTANETNWVLVSYTTPGVKKVVVQSARGDGINIDSVSCTVIVAEQMP